ncbi:MAG: dicarboxylate/amino acid:cation symporter [Clostridia bacterium]|nr:dicarboxylate/amino acid:cation symporter [Clostridia bacterium]
MKFDEKTPVFTLTYETLDTVSEQVREYGLQNGATEQDLSKVLLLLEEISVRFLEFAPTEPVELVVRKRLGRLTLILSTGGEDFNPISELTEWAPDSENYFRALIFRANAERLDYARRNGRNLVFVRAYEARPRAALIAVAALLLGIILGLLLLTTLAPETAAKVENLVFDPVRTLFFKALGMLVTPLVFFSVVSTMLGLSSLADTGRLGGKAMATYVSTTFAAIVLSLVVGNWILPAELPEAVQKMAVGKLVETSNLATKETLLSVVPENLLEPIQSGNIMQVLVLAVLTGLALSILGDKIQILTHIIRDLERLLQTLVNMVAALMPLITVVATASLVMNAGLSVLPVLGSLILVELLIMLLMVALYSLNVLAHGLSLWPFLRALPGYFKKSGLHTYSGGYLPTSMEVCTKTFGVSPRVTSFTTSLGATVNMDGSCIHLVLCSLLFLRMYGVPLTPSLVATLALATTILSVGGSAVQHSDFISLTPLMALLGIPTGALGLVMGIDQVLDMLRCGSNIIGDLAATITIGKSEGELKKDVYKKAA